MNMENLHSKLSIQINNKVYLKDPESSELGKLIISNSIDLIDELGFDEFTFRKLAAEISSTEASIYRYFINKHYLLVYLTMWYWSWQEYRLAISLMNIDDAKERLKRAVNCIAGQIVQDSTFSQVNEIKLARIVSSESDKILLSKRIDEVNKIGLIKPYKDLVERVALLITDLRPDYKYPHMLVSTIIEGANHQRFYAEHLPRLTDVVEGEDTVTSFFTDIINKTLHPDDK
jgi:AcrR family transcriptional regulator